MIGYYAFYVFAFIAVVASLLVVGQKNPMHSVMLLIVSFGALAGLYVLLDAPFTAVTQIIVYAGAIMVLFLFVVMMLDVNFAELREGFLQYLPVGAFIGIILLIELLLVVFAWTVTPDVHQMAATPIPPIAKVPNAQALGHVLYTSYVYFFQAAWVVLLVAMIGAIVLTLHHKPNVRRQDIAGQIARNKKTAIDIVKVKPGQGL